MPGKSGAQPFQSTTASETFASWMKQSSSVRKNTDVVIVSPYLGRALVEIITALREKGCTSIRVYGLFTLKVFADRSSDFSAVKEVFQAPECQFFHLENLHSKYILFGKKAAIFGSQNVTKKDGFNLELNCQTTDPVFLRQLKAAHEEMAASASPVTRDWFELIERHLSGIEKEFERFDRACANREEGIKKENDRLARQAKKEERLRIQNQRLQDLEDKTVWHLTEDYRSEIRINKQRVSEEKWRLVSKGKGPAPSMLKWENDINFEKERCDRFFCLFQRNRDVIPMIGFARMAKYQVSFIGSQVTYSNIWLPQSLSGLPSWGLTVSAFPPPEQSTKNMRIELTLGESYVKFDALFLGHQFFIQTSIKSSGEEGDSLKKNIESRKEILVRRLIERLMSPFKYEDGIKYWDEDEVQRLLNVSGHNWRLRLGTPHGFSKHYFFHFQAI